MKTTRVQLEPEHSQVRVARQHLHDACRGMPRDLIEVAILLMTELVTNAIRHGRGVVRLAIKQFPSRLCVEVSDAGPELPTSRNPDTDHAGGRGLMLVERLATQWGVVKSGHGPGKTVWFTLRKA